MKVVDRYSKRNGWYQYTFIEDMKSFAIMHLFLSVPRFNPNRVTKPWAYFAQVTQHAFEQYLQSERKYRETQQNYAELIQESASIYGYPLREEE